MSPPLHGFVVIASAPGPAVLSQNAALGTEGLFWGRWTVLLRTQPVSLPCCPCCCVTSEDEPRGWGITLQHPHLWKLHLQVERSPSTAIFAVPHSDFASCFRHLSAWWDLFHPSPIYPLPCFCFSAFSPLQGVSFVCSGWVCEP